MEKNLHEYKYLPLLINIFVVVLLVSNLIAPKFVALPESFCSAAASLFGSGVGEFLRFFRFSVAQLLFPITYIFGDVLTEVYGYSASRRAIWTGFLGASIMTVFGIFAVIIPGAPEFKDQAAFATIFGVVPRNVAGSLLAYWAGEFANSFTVAKMKVLTKGRFLWMRTLGSTVVGQLVDTTIVIFFIFYGQPLGFMARLIISGYLFKVGYEALATPLTYVIINGLKRAEGVDYYDRSTNFNPFAVAEKP